MFARRTPLLLLVCTALCSACSVMPSGKIQSDEAIVAQPASFAEPAKLIAADLVNAFEQLPGFVPASTHVDMQRSDQQDEFTNSMAIALQNAGYAVRWINEERTTSLFQYRTLTEEAPAGATTDTYEVAIGIVEMRRSYAIDNNQRVMPVTPLYMRGVDASGVVLNDRLFEQAPLNEPALLEPVDTPVVSHKEKQDQQTVQISSVALNRQAEVVQTGVEPAVATQNTVDRSVPSEANPLRLLSNQSGTGSAVSLPLLELPREDNMYELGGSNFQDLLVEREVVSRQILTFGNDSLRLGESNKRLVEKMVEQFNPESDIFSVVGCSLGPTQVEGGNAALALGRAGRVVEALRFAGVANNHILDEGCWASSGSVDDFPRRGVVLTLNRKSR